MTVSNQPVSVVTGASGFIGTHLMRRLVQEGKEVIAIDRKPPREIHPGVQYIETDVRDLSQVQIKKTIDTIYNFAAVHTTPGHEPYEYYSTNVLGALEVTRLAERAGVSEIVFTSSISVYGPSETMKTEQSSPEPVSDYGHSKLQAEKIHENWLDSGSASKKLTVIRPAVVFGAGEYGNFTRLAKLLKKGVFVYPGRKDTIKSCIYVEDLLDAIEFARTLNKRHLIVNGSYPSRPTLEQIVTALKTDYFSRARTITVPRVAVTSAAKVIGAAGFLDLGIHPDRVMKLVRSTDVYPQWLVDNDFPFPTELAEVFKRWHRDTKGEFI